MVRVVARNSASGANINEYTVPVLHFTLSPFYTNQQSPVNEADRRSNDKIQLDLQRNIFASYGFYYERKRGEFADGIRDKYIQRNQIIERELFLRLCMACDLMPAQGKRSSQKVLFGEKNFSKSLNDAERFQEYFFAYQCNSKLNEIEKECNADANNRFGVSNYGQALRFGKFAVISICVNMLYEGEESLAKTTDVVEKVLDQWMAFEEQITSQPSNNSYFRVYTDPETNVQKQDLNFAGYYKGKTLNYDLQSYFLDDEGFK